MPEGDILVGDVRDKRPVVLPVLGLDLDSAQTRVVQHDIPEGDVVDTAVAQSADVGTHPAEDHDTLHQDVAGAAVRWDLAWRRPALLHHDAED